MIVRERSGFSGGPRPLKYKYNIMIHTETNFVKVEVENQL